MISLAHGPLFRYKVVSSTMDVAFSMVNDTMHHGTSILSSHQTWGRGSQGRRWEDAEGENLLATILLQGDLIGSFPESGYGHCAIRTALAIVRVLERMLPQKDHITIKWPNDVLVHEKKIAGILIESRNHWIGLGIGLNVGQSRFPPHLTEKATSIVLSQGGIVPIINVFHHIRDELDYTLTDIDIPKIVEPYLWRYNEVVYAQLPSGDVLHGIHRGVSGEGALILESDGRMNVIHSASLFQTAPEKLISHD